MQQLPEAIRDAVESLHLPSIPHVLLRFLNAVEDDDASMKELAELVAQDPALSARFLTVANSPALRREKEIKSLDQCIVTLGTRLARTLAACIAIQSVFSCAGDKHLYDFSGFWSHSLKIAEIARQFATNTNKIDADEAYIAALLHDVGQLLLLGGVGQRYGDMLRCSTDEAVLLEIEGLTLGTDHAAVGAWLIDQWKLSSFMSDAVMFHHKPLKEIFDADPLSQIIWSSHIVSNYNDKTDLALKIDTPCLAAVNSLTGFDISEVTKIRNESFERVTLLASALGIHPTADTNLPSPIAPTNQGFAQSDKDAVHVQMQNTVRDMAIMRSLQRDLTAFADENEILLAVKESARILFGLWQVAFLFVKHDQPFLSGPDFDGQPALLQRLEIKLENGQSLAAAVAQGEMPYSTFDAELPVPVSLVDIQIARAMESQGLLYVPMATQQGLVGLMVFGITDSKNQRVEKHRTWMANFAGLAASAVQSYRQLKENNLKLESALSTSFKEQARKVAHEAGNPLSIIKNYLQIVSQKLPAENGVLQELEILREEIDRISTIINRLGVNSEEILRETGLVDINGIIEGLLILYSDTLFSSRGITVEKMLQDSLPKIEADRDSIKQILFNLCKNAAEAMPNGGSLSIATRSDVNENGRRYLEICLSDSGPGLPDDVRQQIFQPLDPNRRPGNSGLGLSIVASLVERLEGLISYRSEKGQGTSFYILLPQTEVDEK